MLSGESLTLDCSAGTLQGTAKPQIHWLDQRGARVEGSGNTHTFTATSVQDNGQWTCVVTSKGTVGEGKISVSVAGEFQQRGHTVLPVDSGPLFWFFFFDLFFFFQ